MLFTVFENFSRGNTYSGTFGEDNRGKFIRFPTSELPSGIIFAGKSLISEDEQFYNISYSKVDKDTESETTIVKAYF